MQKTFLIMLICLPLIAWAKPAATNGIIAYKGPVPQFKDSERKLLTPLQVQIDAINFDIFSTPTVLNFLQTYQLHCSRIAMWFSFGLSWWSAQDFVRQHCAQGPKEELLLRRTTMSQRAYEIKFDPKRVLSGWTKTYNKTEIILETNNHSNNEIAAILAHELAVYIDNKSMATPGSSHLLGWRIDNSQPYLEADLMSSLNDTLISNLLAAMRAFEIEKRIMQDLASTNRYHFDSANFSLIAEINKSQQTCAEALDKLFFNIDFLKAIISQSLYLPQINWSNGDVKMPGKESFELSLVKAWPHLNTVKSARVLSLDNQQTSLCQIMVSPELGVSNSRMSNGPRPARGGTGG